MTSQGPDSAAWMLDGGEMTPIEGTPWTRPVSEVHWKPSRGSFWAKTIERNQRSAGVSGVSGKHIASIFIGDNSEGLSVLTTTPLDRNDNPLSRIYLRG